MKSNTVARFEILDPSIASHHSIDRAIRKMQYKKTLSIKSTSHNGGVPVPLKWDGTAWEGFGNGIICVALEPKK